MTEQPPPPPPIFLNPAVHVKLNFQILPENPATSAVLKTARTRKFESVYKLSSWYRWYSNASDNQVKNKVQSTSANKAVVVSAATAYNAQFKLPGCLHILSDNSFRLGLISSATRTENCGGRRPICRADRHRVCLLAPPERNMKHELSLALCV